MQRRRVWSCRRREKERSRLGLKRLLSIFVALDARMGLRLRTRSRRTSHQSCLRTPPFMLTLITLSLTPSLVLTRPILEVTTLVSPYTLQCPLHHARHMLYNLHQILLLLSFPRPLLLNLWTLRHMPHLVSRAIAFRYVTWPLLPRLIHGATRTL